METQTRQPMRRRRYTQEERTRALADVAALGVSGAAKQHGITNSVFLGNAAGFVSSPGAHVRLDDLFVAVADWPAPAVGAAYTQIVGVLNYSFSNYKLAPRIAADIVAE